MNLLKVLLFLVVTLLSFQGSVSISWNWDDIEKGIKEAAKKGEHLSEEIIKQIQKAYDEEEKKQTPGEPDDCVKKLDCKSEITTYLCGSDNKTYDNYCVFTREQICYDKPDLTYQHFGECADDPKTPPEPKITPEEQHRKNVILFFTLIGLLGLLLLICVTIIMIKGNFKVTRMFDCCKGLSFGGRRNNAHGIGLTDNRATATAHARWLEQNEHTREDDDDEPLLLGE